MGKIIPKLDDCDFYYQQAIPARNRDGLPAKRNGQPIWRVLVHAVDFDTTIKLWVHTTNIDDYPRFERGQQVVFDNLRLKGRRNEKRIVLRYWADNITPTTTRAKAAA